MRDFIDREKIFSFAFKLSLEIPMIGSSKFCDIYIRVREEDNLITINHSKRKHIHLLQYLVHAH